MSGYNISLPVMHMFIEAPLSQRGPPKNTFVVLFTTEVATFTLRFEEGCSFAVAIYLSQGSVNDFGPYNRLNV